MSELWATQQELTFLKHLGTYRQGHEMTSTRLQLLANYVKVARERVDWGHVNGEQVIRFAEAQLAEERLKTG
ncbi:MAG: hypothetical protein ETSY1_37510 [Candidatus Entotheonella factor]|uniref:Uncharacterized protein n=1 Tax=Entotheonella factor TaxID=1429438 RepID=W4L743_ENTF1|nr:MAG: hypothetical protein ETSY1_37510 [Candidatus Entotheonella factor]